MVKKLSWMESRVRENEGFPLTNITVSGMHCGHNGIEWTVLRDVGFVDRMLEDGRIIIDINDVHFQGQVGCACGQSVVSSTDIQMIISMLFPIQWTSNSQETCTKRSLMITAQPII